MLPCCLQHRMPVEIVSDYPRNLRKGFQRDRVQDQDGVGGYEDWVHQGQGGRKQQSEEDHHGELQAQEAEDQGQEQVEEQARDNRQDHQRQDRGQEQVKGLVQDHYQGSCQYNQEDKGQGVSCHQYHYRYHRHHLRWVEETQGETQGEDQEGQ